MTADARPLPGNIGPPAEWREDVDCVFQCDPAARSRFEVVTMNFVAVIIFVE